MFISAPLDQKLMNMALMASSPILFPKPLSSNLYPSFVV